jgi:hypothetical protein
MKLRLIVAIVRSIPEFYRLIAMYEFLACPGGGGDCALIPSAYYILTNSGSGHIHFDQTGFAAF